MVLEPERRKDVVPPKPERPGVLQYVFFLLPAGGVQDFGARAARGLSLEERHQ